MTLIKSEPGEFPESELALRSVGGDLPVSVFLPNMCLPWIVLSKGETTLKNYELEFEIMKVKMLSFNL